MKRSVDRGPLRVETLFAIVSPLVLLVVWEIAARASLIDRRIFSSPTLVVGLAWEMFAQQGLMRDVLITAGRIALGLVVGGVPGVLLGLTMGLFRTPRALLNPIVQIVYPLPRIALFPLVLIVVGVNETSNILMVALGPFFTMLESAMTGVMNVDRTYLRVARSFETGTADLYRHVVFPAALPTLFSGLRLSLGMTLFGVVAVEYLSASNGVGHMIWNAWQVLSLGRSMVGLVITGLLGYGLVLASDALERRVVPWVGARAR